MAWVLCCYGSGLGWRLQLIGPLAWEPLCAVGVALKRQKKKTKKVPHYCTTLYLVPFLQIVAEIVMFIVIGISSCVLTFVGILTTFL